MKIPRHKHIVDGNLYFTYIDVNDISKRYREEFDKWMTGQTVPKVEGCDNPVYSWDWDRWYSYKLNGDKLLW